MKQKKFYSTQLLLLAAIALFFSCGSKKQASHYSVQDEISEKLAEYKTAGWQIQGSSRTLRGVLSSVIDRLNENPDLVEVTGTANNFAVVSIGNRDPAGQRGDRQRCPIVTSLGHGKGQPLRSLLQYRRTTDTGRPQRGLYIGAQPPRRQVGLRNTLPDR